MKSTRSIPRELHISGVRDLIPQLDLLAEWSDGTRTSIARTALRLGIEQILEKAGLQDIKDLELVMSVQRAEIARRAAEFEKRLASDEKLLAG